ncbi:MAG: hypothetical protein EOP49_30630 [Sphingobacteriales bacterium]|nr:MAG: hypothetical protein EOP49_30630 [Sphingobacteriales bacterium]
MKKVILFLVVITALGFLFGEDFIKAYADDNSKKHERVKEKKVKKSEDNAGILSPEISVVQRWELPDELREVSGIVYLDKNRFACVQDEAGTVYIYNAARRTIERKVAFGPAGDYEGITLAGKAVYIVRSDGTLYEINDIHREQPEVKSYNTSLTETQNIEGLCYDKAGNRLLLAVKDQEPGSQNFKGIYEFSIASKTLKAAPVFRISLADRLAVADNGKKTKVVRPSAIGKHPASSYHSADNLCTHAAISDMKLNSADVKFASAGLPLEHHKED